MCCGKSHKCDNFGGGTAPFGSLVTFFSLDAFVCMSLRWAFRVVARSCRQRCFLGGWDLDKVGEGRPRRSGTQEDAWENHGSRWIGISLMWDFLLHGPTRTPLCILTGKMVVDFLGKKSSPKKNHPTSFGKAIFGAFLEGNESVWAFFRMKTLIKCQTKNVIAFFERFVFNWRSSGMGSASGGNFPPTHLSFPNTTNYVTSDLYVSHICSTSVIQLNCHTVKIYVLFWMKSTAHKTFKRQKKTHTKHEK